MQALGPRVLAVSISPLSNYRVHVEFDNGVKRQIDLEPFLHGPIFEPVRSDGHYFRSMQLSGGVITWPNGADIDPDVLYYDLTPAWMENSEPA